VLTVTWTALTVRPVSGPPTGICSFSTSETTPTVTLVFGATLVGAEITTVLPTWRKAIVVVPVDPPQVVVDGLDRPERDGRDSWDPTVASAIVPPWRATSG